MKKLFQTIVIGFGLAAAGSVMIIVPAAAAVVTAIN